MSDHKGWIVRPDKRRGTWRGEVRVGGKYRSKSFPTAAAARAWAQVQAAGVVSGAPSAALVGPQRVLLVELARDYCASLDARRRSPSHLRNVRGTLAELALVVPDLAADSAPRAIERWIDQVDVPAADQVGPATRNRRRAEVRALCAWALRRDLIAKDPTRAIERAQVPDTMRPQFAIDELRALLALPTPDPVMHRRVALLAYLGLRADEAAALTWADIDLHGRIVMIRMHAGHRLKRERERIVPLPDELAALLTPSGPGGQAVAPLSDSNPRRQWPAYLRACGVELRKRSQHSLRHSYAGVMTATGVPGPLLSAYLGHSSAATTMIYTRLAARYVQAVAGWRRGDWSLFGPSAAPK